MSSRAPRFAIELREITPMTPIFRRLLLVVFACGLPLMAVRAADPAPPPPAFQEGKEYGKLTTPMPPMVAGKPEVIEFFSYNCPHCHDLEPTAQEWLKRKPNDVQFIRVPVSFNPSWEVTSRAYYVAESLGVLEKMHRPLFEAIHRDKRSLASEDEVAALFVENGVDEAAFRKAYKSFQTETQMRRANQLVQRYGVRGVPMLVVNGQYDVRSPRMFEVVDFLLAR